MATRANERGIGGALRRKPSRKTASTPYERPPTALRGANGGVHVAEGGGLISMIVDPASRLIARGASRLFSSVFRKHLTAPTRTSEEDHQSREDASHVTCHVLSPEIHKGDSNGDNQTNNSGSGGIADLEQLLKQKTFTRVEFDRLAELLRSRTVENLKADHENNNEKMEEASVSAQEGGLGSSKAHESLSVLAGNLTVHKKLQITQDEAASPAEIAKAYMVSRPLKGSPSVGSFSNQVFQGAANLSTPTMAKRLDFSVAPRSVIRFSGIPDHPQHGSQTARLPSRSAIYRMSRSPYFKVGELSMDHYSCESSQWTPNTKKSGGRQALKRGRSTLDGDFESVGLIRRIRQKSNLMSTSKGAHTSLSGSHEVENENFTINMLPPQSSETAQKLFNQLGIVLPSPKDKSSEQKTIARDEPPPKLTIDMLHGSALRSIEDVDSSKFLTTQGNGNLDTASASHLPNVGNSHSQKFGVVEEDSPLKSVGSGVKSAFVANGVISAPIPSKDAKLGMRSDNIDANSVAHTVPKRTGFQMSAPEDALELDDDDYNASNLSTPFTTAKGDADAQISTNNNVISATAISESPPISSQSAPISSSVLFKKDLIQPVVTGKNKGFAFAVASDSCMHSHLPPTPTMPNPLLDRPDLQKEQTTSPTFSFGSNDAKLATCVTDTAGVKVGEGSRSELTPVTSASTTSSEGSILVKSEPHKNGGDIFTAFGNTISSSISTLSTPVFAFGASPARSLSNGSLHSSSPAFSVPGTSAAALSEGPGSSIVNSCTATTSSSSSSSVYTAAATFSTVPSFQFGSGISTAAPVTVSQSVDKSNTAVPLERSVKAAPFSLGSSTSQGASAVFPSTVSSGSSDVASSVTITSNVVSSFAPSTSLMNSGATRGSSASASLFSSTAGSSFTSSAFPSTDSSVFGFTMSAQSTSSRPTLDKISSHECAAATIPSSAAATAGATGGSANSSSFFASNSFPGSTANVFGANGVTVFGNQSTQSGTGASQLSQNSTSQFGSFSSSPSFGLGNSSTGTFGNSPFGPVTLGAKPFTSGSGFSFSVGTGSSGANISSSFTPAATASPFGSSSQATTSSIFASASNSNTSPSPVFSFGLSTSGSSSSPFTSGSSSSPFTSGSSSASVFPFTSGSATASSTSSATTHLFGMTNPGIRFGSNTQGNDQMNEDSMTDDTNQAAAPSVPTFGQAANPPSFAFGSPAVQPVAPPVFQFGGSQNPPFSQNPSPFQQAGNVEFNAGGSFSLGSGGGDKSNRKFIKVKRDKVRRK